MKKYLFDIVESVSIIEAHIADSPSFKDFSQDQKTRDAVERRLGIIGEALWQASKIDGSLAVSDMKRIIGLRHILIHDYDLIDAPIIWTILKNNISILKEEATKLLED